MALQRAVYFILLCPFVAFSFPGGDQLPPGIIKDFDCGKLYYRTFLLDEPRNVLYVGGMDNIFKVDLENVNATSCLNDGLRLESSNVDDCVAKGKSEKFDCRNHIRVIQPMGDGERLYVCGTSAHQPKDLVIHRNLTQLSRREYVPGVGDGIAKCPFDPRDNSTAIWVEDGNPGGLPGLYSGTVAEFTKADTVIFRMDLYDRQTRRKKYPFKRTLKYDSGWLDKPNFVGSFDVGEFVYFFFRETAVEYINCGKSVYSRVGRVCKSDVGGRNILNQNWATYLKARLNCSIPGEFPFYFNEIQDVYQIPGEKDKFYATFTTSLNGLEGSALCVFSQDSIEKTFDGKFKEQASSTSAWLPVLSSKVPTPRPGTCVNDTQKLQDTVLNFIRSHPLMDQAVTHENERPVWYKRNVVFTKLVVDVVKAGVGSEARDFIVYFVGTTTGDVYKIVQWFDERGNSNSRLVDVYPVTNPEPVRALTISQRHKSIYVASDSKVRQVNVNVCEVRYKNCFACVRDPHCGWDKELGLCRSYYPGLMQDVPNKAPGMCQESLKPKSILAHWGQTIHLSCGVSKSYWAAAEKAPVWYKQPAVGAMYPVTLNSWKYIATQDDGLVIISVNARDNARYDCRLGSETLASYNVTISEDKCLAPTKSKDFQQVYSDWCNEFERYKIAVKNWEKKQAQCGLQKNRSSDHHPNEIPGMIRSPIE